MIVDSLGLGKKRKNMKKKIVYLVFIAVLFINLNNSSFAKKEEQDLDKAIKVEKNTDKVSESINKELVFKDRSDLFFFFIYKIINHPILISSFIC